MVELGGKVSERGIRRSEVRFLMGNLGVFLLIIFILLCFNVLSTVPRENRLADFLYIYIYIYILRSIPSLTPIACYDKSM